MKKTYNCPATEVSAIKALQNMLSESNPFADGGGTGSETPIMSPNRKPGDKEPF